MNSNNLESFQDVLNDTTYFFHGEMCEVHLCSFSWKKIECDLDYTKIDNMI